MATPYTSRYLATRPVLLGLAKLIFLSLCQLPLISAAPTLSASSLYSHSVAARSAQADSENTNDPKLWLNLGVSAALVLSGGAFAGLTIALMGQDEVYLQVIQSSGEAHERKNAASVLNLLKRGKHWVLVTLLLSNVITNETLPIVLDRALGGGWPAVLGSTTLIVIFGEIVPQSICVRYGLPIGAWMAPCVLILMYIMSPVAYPVAKLLDRLLGEDHGTIYKKAGLKTLVTLHRTLGEAGEQLNSDEVTIISAVLDLKEKAVGGIMTPMEDVFTMSADTILDEPTMDLILSQGYSRIPIHAPDNPLNFVGMLLVKMLITYDPEDGKRVRDFALATLPETRPGTSCLDIVNFFQEGKSHMVLVSEYPSEDRGALGVVTLEDVIEELIGEEIIDESDVFIDVHKAIRRMAPAPKSRVPKGKIVEEPPMMPSSADGDPSHTDGETRWPTIKPPADVRRSSIEAPQPRFQLRRQNGSHVANSLDAWVTHRGATDEIREHLKHLGPSNLASRPRQTRYQSVKIKRGGGSPTRSGQTDLESDPSRSESRPRPPAPTPSTVGLSGGIGAGLVQSGIDASDGVYAVKAGYGTMDQSVHDLLKNDENQPLLIDDNLRMSIPEPVHEERDDPGVERPQGSRPPSDNSTDSTQYADRFKIFNYKHRGPARSGSITEQVIDVNGIRKVVLHTTSTSSSEAEGQRSPGKQKPPAPQNGGEVDQDGKSEDDRSKTHGAKKRRRRRKRHNDSSKGLSNGQRGEDQPLLKQ